MKKILILCFSLFAFTSFAQTEIGSIGYGTSDPSTSGATAFKAFYNTTSNAMKWWNGVNWVTLPNGTCWLLGTQATGANANIGMNDAFRFGISTGGTARLYFGATGRMFSNTLTDVILEPTDSFKISGNTLDVDASAKFNKRIQGKRGTDVASANDITLGQGNFFYITGTTQINALHTSGWQAGSEITLMFQGVVTVKNNTAGGGGTAPMILASGTDFATTANDVLKLQYDGSNWIETGRSLN